MAKNIKMEDTIKSLQKALKDPLYRKGWVASIVMCHFDADNQFRKDTGKVGKRLNIKDKITIANNGAENFLNLLGK